MSANIFNWINSKFKGNRVTYFLKLNQHSTYKTEMVIEKKTFSSFIVISHRLKPNKSSPCDMIQIEII